MRTNRWMAYSRCRIEFWPHWISTRGVLIQRVVIRIQLLFHVELRPPETGGHCITTPRRIKFGPPIELWPRVFIPRWIMTPGLNSTLNCDPKTWFNVQLWPWNWITTKFGMMTRVIIQREIWPGVIIPRWIVTPGHNSTLNFVPGSWVHVELWPGSRFHVELWPRVMIPRWIATPSEIVTCDLDHNSMWNSDPGVIIQRGILTRGHNSTWNSDPCIYLLPVELQLKKVSEYNSVIKIQQLRRVIIQRKSIEYWPRVGIQSGGQNFILHRLPILRKNVYGPISIENALF